MTIELFYRDPYQTTCDATITSLDTNGVWLNQTIFYPTGGGQPGDTGHLMTQDGIEVKVTDTTKLNGDICHMVQETPSALKIGDSVRGTIDWERRYRHMRYHTCLHLLCSIIPFAVTGGSINEQKARLDFNMPDQTIDKAEVTQKLNQLIQEDHPVEFQWITDEELQNNMDMVRTMSVKPPMGQGKVRLVHVKGIDLQPCGGTHLTSTKEIGKVRLGKVESKGKQNRRINVLFDE